MKERKATIITIIILLSFLSLTYFLYNYSYPEEENSAACEGIDKATREKLIKKYQLERPAKRLPNIFNGDFGTSFK